MHAFYTSVLLSMRGRESNEANRRGLEIGDSDGTVADADADWRCCNCRRRQQPTPTRCVRTCVRTRVWYTLL